MSGYFIYYTEANLVCVIIFGIMLLRDLFSVDRQEKQIKFDHALIAFMLYFISDALWAAIIAGMLPRNRFTVVATNFSNCIIMAAITYLWLQYVMVVEQVPHRERTINQFSVAFPFIVSTVAMIALFLINPRLLLSDALELQPAYNIFLVIVPSIYITAVIVYTSRRAFAERNPFERRKHLFVGLFPLLVIVGGVIQLLALPETPIFCFCCTILMLIFYIQSMEGQISIDPLTRLNNRGQLLHYLTQEGGHRDGRLTYVIMLDINDFKKINDTYGHAEGDRALVLVADALRKTVNGQSAPAFLGRYGGDEFIIILHPEKADFIEPLVDEIRAQIERSCRAEGTPYTVSVGIGYDALRDGEDTLQICMQRADEKLYLDKARSKRQGYAARTAY
ncbi:MAG: GGDEF domain-containing protein [Clostridia bacterium]|nr:GGDEF domain-containing protein [Clostridia bacterium]